MPVLLVLAAMPGCGGDADAGASLDQVDEFIPGVSTSDGTGVAALRTGEPPSESGGPAVTEVTAEAAVVTGGSLQVGVTSETEFDAVIVAVEGATGYYELDFGAARQGVDLVLTIGQSVPTELFQARFALMDAAGAVGPYVGTDLSVTEVVSESRDIQVTVSWDVDSDLDLVVVDPDGDSLNATNPSTPSGGQFDLSSNNGCEIDGLRNESAGWPGGEAPNGTYTVQVLRVSDCDASSTSYALTVLRTGQPLFVRTGTIEGDFFVEDHTFNFDFTGGETDGDDEDLACLGIPETSADELGNACEGREGCETGVCDNNVCRQLCSDRCDAVCGDGTCELSDTPSTEPFGQLGVCIPNQPN
jgi:hypothetical protein